jgi:hypothetical protein
VSSRRSDPHPEILQLVENKTGTPDLVSSAISQCAQHAGIAKPADGVEHAAARCIDQLNGIVSRQNRYARQQREDLGGSAAASHWSGQFPPLAGDFVKALRGDARFGRGDPGRAHKDACEGSKVTGAVTAQCIEVVLAARDQCRGRGTTTRVVAPRRRKIVLIRARPMRPLPSVKVWIDSNCACAIAACNSAGMSLRSAKVTRSSM